MLRQFVCYLLCFISTTAFAALPALTQSITSHSYQFAMRYPATWECHGRDKGVVLCQPKARYASYPLSINIQTLYTKKGGGTYATVNDLMNDFRTQVPLHAAKAHFLSRSPFTFVQANGDKLLGEETTLTFYENGTTMKQRQIMLMSHDGLLFHAWAYRTPATYYDLNQPLATAMLSSWIIY